MKGTLGQKVNSLAFAGALIIFILLAIICYGAREISKIKKDNAMLRETLKVSEENLGKMRSDNLMLGDTLNAKESEVQALGNQVGEIASTVGTLKKLSETDKELLQKYSKVYFLNENYIPSALSDIDLKYLYQKSTPIKIHTRVYSYLERLLDIASSSKVNLQVISAYRSFGEQGGIKSSYKFTYGAGSANSFSADQGYSEHQLGTAIDFTTPKIGATFSGFSKTSEYQWLIDHAHQYGFVISYPKSNTYYQFEPWHWRFVGVVLATKLHEENKNFYDLDQREIDKYLVNIFD
jgi:LAS superfamily LD-carboxypeptidase LdcB